MVRSEAELADGSAGIGGCHCSHDTCRWLSNHPPTVERLVTGRSAHDGRRPTEDGGRRTSVAASGQLSVSAVSSRTNDVCSELSSAPVKPIVTVCPANEERLNDFWL
jgi:hypothetical protein